MTTHMSRRNLIKTLSAMGVGSAAQQLLSPFHLLAQSVGSASDYRALVCIALEGGCDTNNLVVPLQAHQYAGYFAARPDIAIGKGALTQFNTSKGETYGFHPSIPTIANLYAQGHCAVVANTGPLNQPVTSQMIANNSATIPTNLMNHALQEVQWGTCYNNTSAVASTHSGWGGRIADALRSYSSGQFPIVTSMAAGMVLAFGYGDNSYPAFMSPKAASFPSQVSNSMQLFSKMSSGSTMISAATDGVKAAYQQDAALRAALITTSSFKTQFPQTPIAAQLQQVAQLISCHSGLGLRRQIFLVQHSGFDLHQFQKPNEPIVLGQLDDAINAFQSALQEIGMSDSVLSFTTSDFNRTLAQNSGGGTDHAWGGHQFVFGTALKSADMFGTFPTLAVNGPDDFLGNGAWVPTTSVDQYGATLASWMGVPDSSLNSLFPNLSNFAIPKLGFI